MLDVSTKSWTQVGSLNRGRSGHAVVVRSNDFVIVGGRNTKSTERCEMQNYEMLCVLVEPELKELAYYPEAMLVDGNFCASSDSYQESELDLGPSSSKFKAFLL